MTASVRPTAGPLGRVLGCHDDGDGQNTRLTGAGPGSNARIVLHRTAFRNAKGEIDGTPAIAWASRHKLGQVAALVKAVDARRVAALRKLANQGHAVRRLHACPQWRLAIGHGDHATAYETGLSLHGTYGWPCLPGTALKGAADAYARDAEAGPVSREDRAFLLGSPRPADPARTPARRGVVQFLDALPAGQPVPIDHDVLTPHVQPYYTAHAEGAKRPTAPAEHHHPVPVAFLAVARGPFAIDLVGDEDGVDYAADWLTGAADALGLGGKTSAGYGYLDVTPVELDDRGKP